jgi:hypothetical protein
MSVTRSGLTKAEIIENVARAREMQALGSQICIPQEWLRVAEECEQPKAKLEILQVGAIHDSRIFELDSGRAGYMIDLRLTNHTSRPMYVDVELRLPWHDEMFDWLMATEIPSHFRGKDGSYRAYRFPGRHALEFPCEEVLNHRLAEGGCLPIKRPVRGLLLASGGLLPADLKHGQGLDGTLALIDSDHNEYIQTIKLWTERLELRPSVMVRRRTRLRDDLSSSTNRAVATWGRQPPGGNRSATRKLAFRLQIWKQVEPIFRNDKKSFLPEIALSGSGRGRNSGSRRKTA